MMIVSSHKHLWATALFAVVHFIIPASFGSAKEEKTIRKLADVVLGVPNNHMHLGCKKRSSFLALIFAAGDVKRSRI